MLISNVQSRAGLVDDVDRSARAEPRRLGDVAARIFQTRERRRALRRVATIYFGDFRRRAVVRDMSPGGVMIEMTLPPGVGEKVLIDIPGMAPLTGFVRWRRGNRLGVQFETPILQTEITDCIIQGEWEVRSLPTRNNGKRERRKLHVYPAACTT